MAVTVAPQLSVAATPRECQDCGTPLAKRIPQRVTLCRLCAARNALTIEHRLTTARYAWGVSPDRTSPDQEASSQA